jgi:hypothetical protein
MYILSAQRDADVAGSFRRYRDYLSENRSRLPPSVYALAMSDWYFDFEDHRCPHDAWLESAEFSEPSSGSRSEIRSSMLTVRLLGAFQDGHIELTYAGVRAYELKMPGVACGHGDWRYDEFRVADEGGVVHEIEWSAAGLVGRWQIVAADVIYQWRAR